MAPMAGITNMAFRKIVKRVWSWTCIFRNGQ